MPTIDLCRAGPTEAEWAAVCDRLPPVVLPPCRRLVVVSPHPDDETFGCGGLIATAAARGLPVAVFSVTRGEAASDLPHLADVRARELAAALTCLDPTGSICCRQLGFDDGGVRDDLAELTDVIEDDIDDHDLIVCPVSDDGHPDHEAVSLAATRAAGRAGAEVRWFAVWAWHCHDPRRSILGAGERLDLDVAAQRKKSLAVECYRSQLDGVDPVVPDWMLVRLCRRFEVLVTPR